MSKIVVVPVLLILGSGLLLAGCTQEAKMTPKDQENFKGGPMPPEAAAGMAKTMQEEAAKAAAKKAGQAPPPSPAAK